MVSTAELVVVGRVGSPHGVAGAIRIVSSTQPPENIEHYRPWLLGDGERFNAVEVRELVPHRGAYLASLDGVTDRDQAAALTGLLIAVPRAALPALEPGREYYWQDLIGMTVVDGAGRHLGVVSRLLETGANDVLVIDQGGREQLVPFVASVVLDVDAAVGRIRVDWQEPV